MPTVFTHVAVPVCAAIALGTRRVPVTALLAGMLASIVPDFDGLAFKLGIAYGGMSGHRGFTHTLVFALLNDAVDTEHVVSETFLELSRRAAALGRSGESVHAVLRRIARTRAQALRATRTARKTLTA